MLASRPPLGWNSWNTFGEHISDPLIREMADFMVDRGYRDAGYQYLVIDDCWSLRDRDESGRLVPDPEKFPCGMKAVADYVHSKGLKFGMYSCAGVMTCAGYPSSYDHEFLDAETFASWGVDFLKYDFCNFPETGDCRTRYQTMSMALKSTGREILFSACNWGQEDSWDWMRACGAHMYRSTGDIFDNAASYRNIAVSQIPPLNASAPGCFNDMDMLTVGMYGNGLVGTTGCGDADYRSQFALWCFCSAPLMLGCDIRNMSDFIRKLVTNRDLIRIDQDSEARPPIMTHHPWNDRLVTLFKHLDDGSYALGFFNLDDSDGEAVATFSDFGLPAHAGYDLILRDALDGGDEHRCREYLRVSVPAHDCRVFIARLARR